MNPINLFIIILSFGMISILSSCRPGKLSPEAYIQWVEDPGNGLQMTREMGGFRITARMMPEQYWDLKQGADKNEIADESDAKIRYFQLRIEPKDDDTEVLKAGINDEQTYQERLTYFKYGMQKDLYLVQGSDSLKAILYHYEQSFGLTPFTTSLIAFEDEIGYPGSQTLVLDDQNLGIGPVKFSFSQATLTQIPQLNL